MRIPLLALCSFVIPTLAWAGESAIFIVGRMAELGRTSTNSFLLPLTRAGDITRARKLAAMHGDASLAKELFWDVHLEPIPYFQIGLGSDGLNRDVGSPGEPAWSWHVNELIGWSDTWIPEYPYWRASDIEQGVQTGAVLEDERIAAAGQGVIAEYEPELELFVNQVVFAASGDHLLQFYWTHRAFGDDYEVEWTPVLQPSDWRPVEEPPLNGLRYPRFSIVEVFSPQPPIAFFRLRAGP